MADGSLLGMSEITTPMAMESGIDPRSDVFNRLLKNRVVLLGSDVNDDIANQLCAQLLYLEGEDANADIWLYINSPGGSVTAGLAGLLAIRDVISNHERVAVIFSGVQRPNSARGVNPH